MNGIYSPTMDNMELLAKALKVHISDLYESEYKKCPGFWTITSVQVILQASVSY